MRIVRSTVVVLIGLISTVAFAADPTVYTGDGVEFRVGADGTGTIVFEGKSYPFTTETVSDGTSTTWMGTFTVDGENCHFQAKQDQPGGGIVFTSANSTHRLAQATPKAKNPFKRDNPPATETPAKPGARPAEMRLKQVEFRDRDMGNVVAYTMMVPSSWQPNGFVSWPKGDIVHPQMNFEVRSPEGHRIAFVPAMNLFYMELAPQWAAQMRQMGMPNVKDREGIAPPQDPVQWLVEFIRQSNTAISDLQLVSQQRDEKLEKAMAESGNAQVRAYVMGIEYVRDGVRHHEEISFSFSMQPPIETPQSRMVLWSIFVAGIVSAPADQFDASKDTLYAIANTCRSVPQWWNQVQQTLAEINRIKMEGQKVRADMINEQIRKRGEMYNQISDDQMASWWKQQHADNEMQRRRVNTVNDTADYWVGENTSVKLPGRLYKNAYRTNQGDYILTDNDLNSSELQLLQERK